MAGYVKILPVVIVLAVALLAVLTACAVNESAEQAGNDSQAASAVQPAPTPPLVNVPERVPSPLPVSFPVDTAASAPLPVLRPTFDDQMGVTLDTAGKAMEDGEELSFEFVVANAAPEPASGVTLTFEFSQPEKFVAASTASGPCGGATCDLGSFDGYESMTGRIVLVSRRGFDPPIEVYADLSWRARDLTWKFTSIQVTVMPMDEGRLRNLVWASRTSANAANCGDTVLVGDDRLHTAFGRHLYSVARSDGETLWREVGDRWMHRPFLAEGRIFFHSSGQQHEGARIRSLDALEGTLNWDLFVDGQVRGPGAYYDGSIFYTVNDWVIDGRSAFSYLLSVDAETGALNWQYRVEKWINTFPVVSGGKVYFGTYSGRGDYLYAIDPRSGGLVHRHETNGGTYFTPVFDDESAYIPSGYRRISSMDLATGRKNWAYRPTGRVSGRPVLADGTLYFHVDDADERENYFVHALDAATGNLKWRYEVGSWRMEPTAFNGSVYVPLFDRLVSLDAETGSENWTADYGTICGPLTAADGVLYGRTTTDNGRFVFAIRAD